VPLTEALLLLQFLTTKEATTHSSAAQQQEQHKLRATICCQSAVGRLLGPVSRQQYSRKAIHA